MLEELIEQKYILPDDKYRDGPTATEILEAIKNHPDWVISGWMTSFSRNKQYIFINNCTKSGPTTIDEINDFVRCWRKADEIWVSENELFAGYSVSGG